MKETTDTSIWVEKWRPPTLKDCILTNNIRNYFESCIKEQNLPNMLLYGNSGTGKTTLVKVLQTELNADMMYLNGSSREDRGIANLDKIIKYASTYADADKTFKYKLIYIDEAEQMTPALQMSLKVTIEELEHVARFILSTNNESAIIEPLRSRLSQGLFNLIPANREERGQLALAFRKRLFYILQNENIEYDEDVIQKLIIQKFPDFRKTIATLHQYSIMYNRSKVDAKILDMGKGVTDELVSALKSKNIKELRKIAIDTDANTFFREFDSIMYNIIQSDDENISKATLILGKYVADNGICTDSLIILRACLVHLANNLKFL